jgi:hypothetical protein
MNQIDFMEKANKRMRDILRSGIIGRAKKSRLLVKLIGYDVPELLSHLESLFDCKMSFDNFGTYWHIDHIIQRNKFYFDSYDSEQFKQCWSLSNLRPLHKIENLKRKKK